MPGGVGINLSPHHSCFLLLSACLIKLHHPLHPHPFNHAHTSPFLHHLLSIALARLPALSSSSALLNLAPFALFNLPATHSLCHDTHIHIYSSTPFFSYISVCLHAHACEQYNTEQRNDGWGRRFILIKFPSSFLLPSCVSACPRSKCQQNLGTWSGIWCHITQRTRIQKTSQHAELTWSAAKPAATH